MIFSLVSGAVYFLVQKAGLFSDMPHSALKILYSWPILIDSLLVLFIALWSVIVSRGSYRTYQWVGMISLALIVLGLWTGSLTRFSGEVILTEGQDFYSFNSNYLPGSFYKGKYADAPHIGLKMKEILPSFSEDVMNLKGIRAVVEMYQRDGKDPVERTLTDSITGYVKGSMLRVRDLGYSPRYVLSTGSGKQVDSSFIYMKLFPPGSEGYFRLLSPLTYYVRYFPDNPDAPIKLRIVRNKDIIFNGALGLSEKAEFENSSVAFEEVRKWTKLVIIKDRGLFMAAFGLCLLGFCLLISIIQSMKSKGEI